MTNIRVFYDAATKQVISIEHRADEAQLGVGAYTDGNRPEAYADSPWFVTDSANRFDPDGEKIPTNFSIVDDSRPSDFRINTAPGWVAEKAKRQNRRTRDFAAEYTAATNNTQRIKIIAESLRLT
jgi:hypothetical protein